VIRVLSSICMRRFLKSAATIVAFILSMPIVGVSVSPSVYANGGTASFSLQPAVYNTNNPVSQSYFVLNLSPDATTSLSLRVTNSGTATGTVRLYSEDAVTAQTGGIVYNVRGAPLRDVGSWISLNTPSLTLAPNQSKIVPFTLTTPRIVRPGEHVGGIIAESVSQVTSTAKNQRFQINVQHDFAMAVQVNLPGSTNQLLIASSIQAGGTNGYQRLQIGLKNTGMLMVSGTGALQVSDAQGTLLQNLPLKLGLFLPQTAINYPVTVQKKALNAGTYRAMLTLNYGHNKVFDHVLNYTTNFTITQQQVQQAFSNGPLSAPPQSAASLPLWMIILLAVLGIVLIVGLSWLVFWRLTVRREKQAKR
jgi:Bacterial protein of unknown function (DUF916)/Protein of unknown function C-terminal (DUF3324)